MHWLVGAHRRKTPGRGHAAARVHDRAHVAPIELHALLHFGQQLRKPMLHVHH